MSTEIEKKVQQDYFLTCNETLRDGMERANGLIGELEKRVAILRCTEDRRSKLYELFQGVVDPAEVDRIFVNHATLAVMDIRRERTDLKKQAVRLEQRAGVDDPSGILKRNVTVLQTYLKIALNDIISRNRDVLPWTDHQQKDEEERKAEWHFVQYLGHGPDSYFHKPEPGHFSRKSGGRYYVRLPSVPDEAYVAINGGLKVTELTTYDRDAWLPVFHRDDIGYWISLGSTATGEIAMRLDPEVVEQRKAAIEERHDNPKAKERLFVQMETSMGAPYDYILPKEDYRGVGGLCRVFLAQFGDLLYATRVGGAVRYRPWKENNAAGIDGVWLPIEYDVTNDSFYVVIGTMLAFQVCMRLEKKRMMELVIDSTDWVKTVQGHREQAAARRIEDFAEPSINQEKCEAPPEPFHNCLVVQREGSAYMHKVETECMDGEEVIRVQLPEDCYIFNQGEPMLPLNSTYRYQIYWDRGAPYINLGEFEAFGHVHDKKAVVVLLDRETYEESLKERHGG